MGEERARRLFLSIPFIGICILGTVLLILWAALWTEEGRSPYDALAVTGVLMILAGATALAFVRLRG